MEYVQFGKTGTTVSRLGFGGAVAGLKNYLHTYDPESEESKKQVYRALETALDLGVTYFDTAPGYGNGASESMFGEVLGTVDPKKIFLATKVHRGLKPSELRSCVEGSLKRLKRDYVDLIQIHGNSYSADDAAEILSPGGFADAMEELKKAGLTRFIGFTSEDNSVVLVGMRSAGRVRQNVEIAGDLEGRIDIVQVYRRYVEA
jgi:aryl-alcohol dehydrogenase-like predicted oxidoreductase